MFGVMTTEPIITNERVDDIPVLLTQIEHMGIQELIFTAAYSFSIGLLNYYLYST